MEMDTARYQKAQNTLPSQGLDLDMEAVISKQIEAEGILNLLDVAQQTSEILEKSLLLWLDWEKKNALMHYQLGSYTGRTYTYWMPAMTAAGPGQYYYNAISACYDNAC